MLENTRCVLAMYSQHSASCSEDAAVFCRPFGTHAGCCVKSPPMNRWATIGCPCRDKADRVPPGTIDNRPPFQRWEEHDRHNKVPSGTTENRFPGDPATPGRVAKRVGDDGPSEPQNRRSIKGAGAKMLGENGKRAKRPSHPPVGGHELRPPTDFVVPDRQAIGDTRPS